MLQAITFSSRERCILSYHAQCVWLCPEHIHARLLNLGRSPLFSKPSDLKHVAGQTNGRAGSPEHAHSLMAVHCRQPCKGNRSLITEGLWNGWEFDCTWGDFPPQTLATSSIKKKAQTLCKISWSMRSSTGYKQEEMGGIFSFASVVLVMPTVCWQSSSIKCEAGLIIKWF